MIKYTIRMLYETDGNRTHFCITKTNLIENNIPLFWDIDYKFFTPFCQDRVYHRIKTRREAIGIVKTIIRIDLHKKRVVYKELEDEEIYAVYY